MTIAAERHRLNIADRRSLPLVALVRPFFTHRFMGLATLVVVGAALGREIALGSKLPIELLAVGLVASLAVFRLDLALVGCAPALLYIGRLSSGQSATIALVGLLLGGWLFGLVRGRWTVDPRTAIVAGSLGGWLLLSYSAFSRPLVSPLSIKADLAGLLEGLLICVVSASVRPSRRHIMLSIYAWSIITAVIIDGVIVQGATRVSILGLNPNSLAIIISMGLVVAVATSIHFRNWLFLLSIPILAIALTRLKSRESIIITAVGLLVLVLVGRRWSVQLVILSILTILIVLVPSASSVVSQSVLGERTQANLVPSDQIRKSAVILAAHHALERPLTGDGYGLFASAASQDPRFGIYANSHNDYVGLAAESGIPALIFFLVLISSSVRAEPDQLGLGLRAVGVTYFAALMFANVVSTLGVSAPFWVMLGCVRGRRASATGSRPKRHTSLALPGGGEEARLTHDTHGLGVDLCRFL